MILTEKKPSQELVIMLTSYVQDNREDYAIEVFRLCEQELRECESNSRIDFLKMQFEWIKDNLEQGFQIPKSVIEAILNSFEKTDAGGKN